MDTDPRLVTLLRDAGAEWGPLGVLRAATDLWPDAADTLTRHRLTHAMSVQRQSPDGSWSPATPLPMQGPVARFEEWARRRGWHRLAARLAAFDERNLGR